MGFQLVIFVFKLAHVADPLQLRQDTLAGSGPLLHPLIAVADSALIYSLILDINFEKSNLFVLALDQP